MSNTHSYYFKESNALPASIETTDNLTSKVNYLDPRRIKKVTVVKKVQSFPVNLANPNTQADNLVVIGPGHKQTSQKTVTKRIEDKDSVSAKSTFPTRIEKGQVIQVPGQVRESITEYKTVGNAFANQSLTQVHTDASGDGRVVIGDRSVTSGGTKRQVQTVITSSNHHNSYTGLPTHLENDVDTFSYSQDKGLTGNDSCDSGDSGLSLGTQTGGSLRSHSYVTGIEEEPVTVQTVHLNVHRVPSGRDTRSVKRTSTLTEQDIRLISANPQHGLRPVTLQHLKLEDPADEDVDDTYIIENQDVRLIPSDNYHERPVIVHNLRLDSSPAQWKSLTVKPIEEEREVSTLHVNLQQSEAAVQTTEQTYHSTRVHRHGSTASKEQKAVVNELSHVLEQRQNSVEESGVNDRNTYIVKTSATPVESVIKRQEALVYQVQVAPHSPDRSFREQEVTIRREKRASVNRSSSSSSSSSAESYSMGNEQNKLAQADVTVEEDEGGNKMIVVEGKNIRVHSENYDTGKKGAKRVVLMPESARHGNKKFQMANEGSVNSYDSYDKRGQKEKMVVINGRLREGVYTEPEQQHIKVAKISTPTIVKKEIIHTTEPQSSHTSGYSTPVGKVTKVNVVKTQHQSMKSTSSSEDRSIEDPRSPNIKQSILLFEKPQHAQQQRMHMGEKGIAHVQRLVKQNHHAPEMVKEVTIRPQQVVQVRSEPGPVEKKVIRVANSAHLARSLKGNELILEKTPPSIRVVHKTPPSTRIVTKTPPSTRIVTKTPPSTRIVVTKTPPSTTRVITRTPPSTTRVVTKQVVTREELPQPVVKEQRIEETKHTAQLQSRPVQRLRRDDDNVFNSHYYIRRENPLYAEIPPTSPRQTRDVHIVKQVSQKVQEEPHYASVNKVRKQTNNVQTEVRVKPIQHQHHEQGRVHKVEVQKEQAVRRDQGEYGLTALLARERNTKVERRVVHDEVEGDISETRIIKTESAPVRAERHMQKEYTLSVPVPPDVPLPKRETHLARVIVEDSITPERSRRVEAPLNFSVLESDSEKRHRKVVKRVERESNNQRSDVVLTNAHLPDKFFYAYEGDKLKKSMVNGVDTVDGEATIEASVSSNVHSERQSASVSSSQHSERQSLIEMAESRQRRIKPKSKSVRQNVNVDHEEADIKGEPHLHHADGSDATARDLLTFDTVSEDVNLGVKEGVAQVEVKVRCERVTPIANSYNLWRKSAVIITRIIEIDLEANEERKELYRKILNNELGGQNMIEYNPVVNGEQILDKKQTFHIYSALMGIADEDEREALMERRPSKLLSLSSGDSEEVTRDVHSYVKTRKLSKNSPRARRKQTNGPQNADFLY